MLIAISIIAVVGVVLQMVERGVKRVQRAGSEEMVHLLRKLVQKEQRRRMVNEGFTQEQYAFVRCTVCGYVTARSHNALALNERCCWEGYSNGRVAACDGHLLRLPQPAAWAAFAIGGWDAVDDMVEAP